MPASASAGYSKSFRINVPVLGLAADHTDAQAHIGDGLGDGVLRSAAVADDEQCVAFVEELFAGGRKELGISPARVPAATLDPKDSRPARLLRLNDIERE